MGTGYKAPEHDPKLGLDKSTNFYVKVSGKRRSNLIYRSSQRLTPRCLCQACPLGKHQGRLFVVGETLLDTTGSTPISVHIVSRRFWKIIKGKSLRDTDSLIQRAGVGLSSHAPYASLQPTAAWTMSRRRSRT